MPETIKERVLALRDEQRPDIKSVRKLETTIGISNGALASWNKSKPSSESIQLVADFFNVSTDYILGKTTNKKIATETEAAPLDLYEVDDSERDEVLSINGEPISDDDWLIMKAIMAKYPKKG